MALIRHSFNPSHFLRASQLKQHTHAYTFTQVVNVHVYVHVDPRGAGYQAWIGKEVEVGET